MGKGGGGGGGSSTQTTRVELPAWVDRAAQDNLAMAKDIAARPYNPFTGERIAGFNPVQQLAQQNTLNFANGGVGQQQLSNALGITGSVGDYRPGSVIDNVGLYMNPYLQQVAGNTLNDLGRARDMAITGGQAAATQANAFGGSRHGVADAMTNSEFFRNAGNTLSQLYANGYNSATSLAQQDISNQMTGNNQNLAAAQQMANLGGLQRAFGIQDLGLQSQVGDAQRALDQAQKDLAYQQFVEQRDYPLQQLAIRQSALSATPYGQTTTATGTQSAPQANPWGSALGGALLGSSLFGTGGALAATGLGAGMGAGVGALAGLLL